MYWGFYVFDGKAYIPTCAKAEAGFYVHVEPFEVVPVSDSCAFAAALSQTLKRGNPVVPTPRDRNAKPWVLKYAGLKTWAAFEKRAACWGVKFVAGDWEFGPYKRRSDRGWEEDPSRILRSPADSSMDDVAGLVAKSVQSNS
jgi:hypothetical protein